MVFSLLRLVPLRVYLWIVAVVVGFLLILKVLSLSYSLGSHSVVDKINNKTQEIDRKFDEIDNKPLSPDDAFDRLRKRSPG